MQILSGKYKGRSLQVPKKSPIRPTSAKMRETIFHILNNLAEIEKPFSELAFLDICAGTGSVGFEALSQGFSYASFFELDPKHLMVCKRNAEHLGAVENSYFYRGNAIHPYGAKHQHDIVYFDPPYGFRNHQNIIQGFVEKNWLSPESIWIIEHSKRDQLDFDSPNITLLQNRKYGDTILNISLVKTS